MEEEYKVMFYKDGEEIEMDELPNEYLSGIIKLCKDELSSRERLDRVYSRIASDIKEKENNKE